MWGETGEFSKRFSQKGSNGSTALLIEAKTWGCVQEDFMFSQPLDTTDVIHHRETSQWARSNYATRCSHFFFFAFYFKRIQCS